MAQEELRNKCNKANIMVTFTLAILEAAAKSCELGKLVLAICEHLEDLGIAAMGLPSFHLAAAQDAGPS